MIAPTYGWLRVGSNGAALGVKKINSTMARMANNMIEQLDTNVDVRSLPQ